MDKIQARFVDEITTRRVLLSIHATLGLFVGLTMMVFGAPPPLEALAGPDSRYALGALAATAGALILTGVFVSPEHRRGWRLTTIGMLAHAAWQLVMMSLYFSVATREGFEPLAPGEVAATTMGRPYVTFVYFSLSLLSAAHLLMLWKARPPR